MFTLYRGKRRKYGNEHAISHPIVVYEELLPYYKDDYDVLVAALLHDVTEDFGVSIGDLKRKFSEMAGYYVDWLTERKEGFVNRAKRKQWQRYRLSKAPSEVQSIKYADMIHNAPSVIKNDPEFAKTYMSEIRGFVSVMEIGHPELREYIIRILDRYYG